MTHTDAKIYKDNLYLKDKDILIVDDHPDNLKLIHSLLLKSGANIRMANSGKMALQSVMSKQPDLILLDITMPNMDGFEVCKQLKANELTVDIPVIYLSALKEEMDIVRGFETGAVDFVSKPFNPSILLARVTAHLRISSLQKDLYQLNEKLQVRVEERTKKIIETNTELTKSESRLKYALLASNEGIWDWDLHEDVIYYNSTFFTMLGYDAFEFPHKTDSWFSLIHPDDYQTCRKHIDLCLDNNASKFKIKYRMRKNNDEYCWVSSKGMIVERNSSNLPMRITGTHTDIDKEVNTQEELRQLASYDPLTKLTNRSLFLDIVKQTVSRSQRNNSRHAVLFMDLDRFKKINDSLGHAVGDQLLIEVSNILSNTLRDSDIISRFGGDEFTILLQDISNIRQITETATRILHELSKPINLQNHQVVASTSIGIALCPDNGTRSTDLLKNADTAMYHAKNNGGNNYWFFNEAMNQAARDSLNMEESLRNAIKHKEITLHYQPQVDANTGKIVSMEALCRWFQRDGGSISPEKFIPVAEETGLILPIGDIIFDQACGSAKHWLNDNLMPKKISINISASQFKKKDLLDIILRNLNTHKLRPEYLELEITEAMIMDSTEDSINIMKKFKDHGITLAIDDFGTGYSSLSYLREFPIDTLKIDMSFVKNNATL